MSNAWLLAAGMLMATTGGPGGSVLEPGLWHGNEVSALAGEGWLGLTKTGEQFRWRPFLLNVEADCGSAG
jgi:hypothetical protein